MKKNGRIATAALALALAAFAAPAARAAAEGDIWKIFPCDSLGTEVSAPTNALKGGDTLYFAVRLAARSVVSDTFRLSVNPLYGSSNVLWTTKRPAIGIIVNGGFETAALHTWNMYPSAAAPYTDFVFSYQVKQGDFALPVLLAKGDKTIATSPSDYSTGYYLNFNDTALGTPAWEVTYAPSGTDFGDETYQAGFYWIDSREDYDTSNPDYDLSGCNFKIQTVDFDSNDESADYWRSVHQHATDAQPVTAVPTLHVDGTPTNSVTLYVWSEDEDAVVVIEGRDVESVSTVSVHTSATVTAERQVGVIKIVSGKQDYEFNLRGVAATNDATIVVSPTPDFLYYDWGLATKVRREDYYLTRTVRCVGPQPASVTIKPASSSVTATTNWLQYATTLNVALSENPIAHSFTAEIVPEFSDSSCTNEWWDYIRLSASLGTDLDPTLTVPAGNPTVTFEAGNTVPSSITINGATTSLTDGKIYLYALRSDDWVRGQNSMTFKIKTSDTDAQKSAADGGIDGWDTLQSSLTIGADSPVIVSIRGKESRYYPSGDATLTGIADTAIPLYLVVNDIYAGMYATNGGFKVSVLRNSTDTLDDYEELSGEYRPGDGNVLYLVSTNNTLTTTAPSVSYSYVGTNQSIVKVTSTISGKTSAEFYYQAEIQTPATFTVTTDDGATTLAEGDPLSLDITLSRQNTSGDMYAFIRGRGTNASNAMEVLECDWKAADGCLGLPLNNYGYEITGCDIESVMDNGKFQYEIVFLDQEEWTNDTSHVVSLFKQSKVLALTVTNVVPSVEMVRINEGDEVYPSDDGTVTTMGPYPMGVTQELSVVVSEPGYIDQTGTNTPFRTRWRISRTGSQTVTTIVAGDPDSTNSVCRYNFPVSGEYTVTVDLQDKDMGVNKWGDGAVGGKFQFKVSVVNQPAITIAANSPYDETDSVEKGGEASFDVALTFNKCYDFDMWVNLKVALVSGTNGTFLLQETSDVVKQADGTYNVRFGPAVTNQTVYIQTLDGTDDSRNNGWRITPSMVTNETAVVPDSGGRHPHDYYLGVASSAIKVYNVAPEMDRYDGSYSLSVQGGNTNSISTAIGVADEALTWNFDDVDLDFSRGITVQIRGGGGWGPKTYTNRTEAAADGTAGFYPTFSSSGPQQVTLVVKDSDGHNNTATLTWNYLVLASKALYLTAHGPGSGDVSRFSSAAGIGAGRVWAASRSSIAAHSFISQINVGTEKSFRVYGYGYKVGDKADGYTLNVPDGFGGYTLGYYTNRCTALDRYGVNLASGATAYTYPTNNYDANGVPRDSYLYTWMFREQDSSSTTYEYLNSETAPEFIGTTDGGKAVSTDVDLDDDTGSYPDTWAEAIFSVEYLASDNMGDINLDGIPDAYVNKYGFGIVDTSSGQISGNDLTNLGSYNEDADYLPSETSEYGLLIPGLSSSWVSVGKPFTARLEIRGYGESLNDACENNSFTRLPNMIPDRVYTDPRTDPKSTLDGWDGSMPVEYLAWLKFAAANGLDPTNQANWTLWSPERPTDPSLDDTDGDGMPDGYEYFLWYRAHVGYNDAGVHRNLTGRRFDPRNPGEGVVISSDEIKSIFDPASPYGAFSVSQDTDNDGIPDLIEYEIGTNPVDFDTDGDGLPDGYEILVAGTSPLTPYTTDALSDAMRNFDGDAMAYTSPTNETYLVLPQQKHVKHLAKFALVDEDGDTDGIQWYVCTASGMPTNTTYAYVGEGWVFEAGGVKYVSSSAPAYVQPTTNSSIVLAAPLTKTNTWIAADYGTNGLIKTLPVYLPSGTVLSSVPTNREDYGYVAFDAAVEGTYAGWVYGSADVSTDQGTSTSFHEGFGAIAIGRRKDAPAMVQIASLPEVDDTIAYLHHVVYQEFGFDPRTAWNATTPLGVRWGKSVYEGDDEESDGAKDNNYNAAFGYAGVSTRTREFTLYDEFLVMSFFLNGIGADAASTNSTMAWRPTKSQPWYALWNRYTTNGRGPNEPDLEIDGSASGDESNFTTREVPEGSSAGNGADTDGDGVPDGWELYVMAGPKPSAGYRFPAAYNDGYLSWFGPFLKGAQNASYTDNTALSGNDTAGGDGDGLTEFQEFAGTDTTLYYADYSTTIVRPSEHEKWLNKFFPTDPWNVDTDGDGIRDSAEAGTAKYGDPYDDGRLVTIPGGGLNPLSVDTDFDGLPDPWEKQFIGKTVYSGDDAYYAGGAGNPLQGYVDGMDPTVPDAFTVVNGGAIEGDIHTMRIWRMIRSDGSRMFGNVNRDYDRDGLENWQEYMTGTMRCWRYDDPYTPFEYIPDEAYWDDEGAFTPDYEMLNELFGDGEALIDTTAADGGEAQFWYLTLVDRTSPIYNPMLVSGTSHGGRYFSKVENGWDLAYRSDAAGGAWYWFYDREAASWGDKFASDSGKTAGRPKPSKYVCCSPKDPDTDHDGMDDYWELFHGLNPLLGSLDTASANGQPYDMVAASWMLNGNTTFSAWGAGDDEKSKANKWTWKVFAKNEYYKTGKKPRGTGFDFEYFPWLNGLATADPDGDDVRNQIEAVMPQLATTTWLHTDPSPLWMTDSGYSRSLVRGYYRMPGRDKAATTPGATFEWDGTTYRFSDYGAWSGNSNGGSYPATRIDIWWPLYAAGKNNWMFSFEENEGYDSDHDAISDAEETEGNTRTASDPQYSDSPNRRQAMYFGGPENPSVLQTLPEVKEEYPIGGEMYPDDLTFLKFTAECWAKPESLDDSTILERAVYVDESKAGDEERIRKNFQIGIRNGRWYAKFDSNGTLANSCVEVQSAFDADTDWHHLAATYDGTAFTLYVDGVEANLRAETTRQPEYGSSAVSLHKAWTSGGTQPGDYWWDVECALRAIVVGGSIRHTLEGGTTNGFDVANAGGWSNYNLFYKGYVDEIRIWDGARPKDDILDDVQNRTRYTRDTALAARTAFYKDWRDKGNRYTKDANGDDVDVAPELVYHFSFDSVPGGPDADTVAKSPQGFETYQPSALGMPERGAATLSRPEDWCIAWWTNVVAAYGSVYSSPVWLQWIPNTVAHLPRFDGTTLDSFYWSENSCGASNGTYRFARTAEPISRWKQLANNAAGNSGARYFSTGTRHHQIIDWGAEAIASIDTSSNSTESVTNSLTEKGVKLRREFDFTGRRTLQDGSDLVPLGGAFPKSIASMWDDQGASTSWEISSGDADGNNLPDKWEEFAIANYDPEDEPLEWNTLVWWKRDLSSSGKGVRMTAGEAFRRDLSIGRVVGLNADGDVDIIDRSDLAQTADEDFSGTPDWWDDIYGVYGLGGTADTDNDGLSNYQEYLASEGFQFGLALHPKMPMSDNAELDYFRRVGKLYVGEMFTDHDLIEDWWERSCGVSTIDPNVWDQRLDGDEDGWTNWQEARYNAYSRSIAANLVSHADGDTTVIDAPVPTIRLVARYNGKREIPSGATLRVETYTDSAMERKDAEFAVTPGTKTTGVFYLGGWENRTIRGTLSPGYIDIGDIDIEYAQLPQDDMYSWIDEDGTLWLSRPYSEFKEALDRDPNIIQNVHEFEWLHLQPVSYNGATQEKPFTVTDGGYVAIYGERIGKIDIETGDFEFDMSALANLTVKGFYTDTKANAWGIKECIFRLKYSGTVPAVTDRKLTVALSDPQAIVRGGSNSFFAYWDIGSDGAYTPGVDPCGVLRDVEVGWNGCSAEIELTETSAITPRIKLWNGASSSSSSSDSSSAPSDRYAVFGNTQPSNTYVEAVAGARKTRVRVVRFQMNDDSVAALGVLDESGEDGINRVLVDRVFDSEARDFIHEGDFLADGELDIDWSYLQDEVLSIRNTYGNLVVDDLTNAVYAVVFGDGTIGDWSVMTNVTAHPVLIERRYELNRRAPTAVRQDGDSVCRTARPTFRWRIDGEDSWASRFGSTYTAFRVVVSQTSANGGQTVYDSGKRRMPAPDSNGVYSWTPPLYAGAPSPSGAHLVFCNLSNYVWKVYTYNSKFRTDNDSYASNSQVFRLNVTEEDDSSFSIDVNVRYAGPAANLASKVRVQAFTTPDFCGYPAAEALVSDVSCITSGAPARLIGLAAGSYFIRAFIDTDNDFVADDWESQGHLCNRDRASVGGSKFIFNPVSVTIGPEMKQPLARTLYIEDRDTDGDGFPDVWEAEKYGNQFYSTIQNAVDGDEELYNVNPTLTNKLNRSARTLLMGATSAATSAAAASSETSMLGYINTVNDAYKSQPLRMTSMMTGIDEADLAVSSSGEVTAKRRIVGDTVAITSMTFDRASGKVVLDVTAETGAGGEAAVTLTGAVKVAEGAEVTVRVLRADTAGGKYEVVAERTGVTITATQGATVEADVDVGSAAAASGFFKVEIAQ